MSQNEENTFLIMFDEMFNEKSGKVSSMRVMSFMALTAAIVFGIITLFNPKSISVNLVVAFLTAAFGPKAVQKFAEAPAEAKAAEAKAAA